MATLNDYRDRDHWSFSALNQFLNICSLQFAFDRIYRLERAFTPLSLSFGSAFHRTLEWLHLLRREQTATHEAEIHEMFRDLWSRQIAAEPHIRFEEDQTPESCAEQGANLVVAFWHGMDPAEEVRAVNQAFAVPLMDAQGETLEKPLVGEMDCILALDGNTLIVDWKTSARRWPKNQADKSLQATAYLYAYRQLSGNDAQVRFDVAIKNKTPVIEKYTTTRTPDQFHRLVELVKRIEPMIQAEHFLPNEQSYYCSGCPHQAACKAWHRNKTKSHVQMAA